MALRSPGLQPRPQFLSQRSWPSSSTFADPDATRGRFGPASCLRTVRHLAAWTLARGGAHVTDPGNLAAVTVPPGRARVGWEPSLVERLRIPGSRAPDDRRLGLAVIHPLATARRAHRRSGFCPATTVPVLPRPGVWSGPGRPTTLGRLAGMLDVFTGPLAPSVAAPGPARSTIPYRGLRRAKVVTNLGGGGDRHHDRNGWGWIRAGSAGARPRRRRRQGGGDVGGRHRAAVFGVRCAASDLGTWPR